MLIVLVFSEDRVNRRAARPAKVITHTGYQRIKDNMFMELISEPSLKEVFLRKN